jgi:hypothetical protein
MNTSWEFYDKTENGANSAVVSFQQRAQELVGSFNMDNMLKRFCDYERGVGNSMLPSFDFIPATDFSRDHKTVDLIKRDSDYIRNGRKMADLEEILASRTQTRTQKFRMQVFPKAGTLESDVMNKDEAITLGGGNAEAGFVKLVAQDKYVRPMLNSECLENNKTFISTLQDVVTNGFTCKKTRWDGAPDGEDVVYQLPDFCKYTTISDGALTVPDLLKLRARMDNNLVQTPGLVAPRVILLSPNTATEMVLGSTKRDDILQNAVFGDKGTADTNLPSAYGFSFYVHPLIQDNECFVIGNKMTMKVFDWGVSTYHLVDPYSPQLSTILRTQNYGVKVVQPMTLMHISIKGKAAAYDDARMTALETSTDEPLKPIRKKSSGA